MLMTSGDGDVLLNGSPRATLRGIVRTKSCGAVWCSFRYDYDVCVAILRLYHFADVDAFMLVLSLTLRDSRRTDPL